MGTKYNIDSNGNVTVGGSIILPQTAGGVPVSGAVATALEYNEGPTVFTTSLSGCFAVASYTINIFRLNNLVTLIPTSWSGTATASTTNITGSALPARFIPPATLRGVASGTKGGALVAISVEISSAGIITFFGDVAGGNFASGIVAAFNSSPFYYYVP